MPPEISDKLQGHQWGKHWQHSIGCSLRTEQFNQVRRGIHNGNTKDTACGEWAEMVGGGELYDTESRTGGVGYDNWAEAPM